MSIRSHIGSSLIGSGIVTLLIAEAPGSSMKWGVGLVAAGIVVGILHFLF